MLWIQACACALVAHSADGGPIPHTRAGLRVIIDHRWPGNAHATRIRWVPRFQVSSMSPSMIHLSAV